jgi:hypothetical protein
MLPFSLLLWFLSFDNQLSQYCASYKPRAVAVAAKDTTIHAGRTTTTTTKIWMDGWMDGWGCEYEVRRDGSNCCIYEELVETQGADVKNVRSPWSPLI